MLLSLSCEEMQALAACNGLTPNVFLSPAGQRDAMMVAVHQLRSVCHDMQAMGLLCLLVYLAACLSTASEVTTLAEHNRELHCQPILSHSRLLVRARLVKRDCQTIIRLALHTYVPQKVSAQQSFHLNDATHSSVSRCKPNSSMNIAWVRYKCDQTRRLSTCQVHNVLCNFMGSLLW